MWLMTKHGFYSIVQRKPGEFHVRAREARDLENLVTRIPLEGMEVISTPSADYCARLVVDQETVMRILQFLGETLDYSNFKGQVDQTPDQRRKPYHEVWDVLADALGAYGRPGRAG